MLRLRGAGLVAACLALLALGVGTGIASIAVHEKSWAWFLLALAAPFTCAMALRPGWLRWSFAGGWVALLLVAIQGRPEGDYAVMSTVRGYLLLAFALVLVVVAVVTIPFTRRTAESEEVRPGT